VDIALVVVGLFCLASLFCGALVIAACMASSRFERREEQDAVWEGRRVPLGARARRLRL
jgi:hypothetical protein